MRLPRPLLALSFALSLAAVDAAGIGRLQHHQHGENHQPAHPAAGGDGAISLWRWLHDTTVGKLFKVMLKPPAEPPEVLRPSSTYYAQYQHSHVLRFNITSREEEAALFAAVDRLILDVWEVNPDYIDILLDSRDGMLSLGPMLPPSLLQPTVYIPDVAAAIRASYPAPSSTQFDINPPRTDPVEQAKVIDGMESIFFSDYQPLSVVTSWLRLLEAMFPSIAKLTTIGTSYEGREILGLRVGQRSSSGGDDQGPRKTILVTGGLHGREWISTSTVSFLLWSVLTSHGKEHIITKLLEQFDIVFIPVLNPDGYDYTWKADRLWRKSRQQTKTRVCPGLDLDHAFGYEWATNNKPNPCSESYGGEEPFQAVEASELARWAKNETDRDNIKFVGFLDMHSYSQQILFPYSYSCLVDPPNRENLEELAVGLAKAIRLSSGELYGVASACEGAVAASDPILEAGGGSAIDWFYHELHVRYSYQVKLRDTGSYGFLLPKESIVPTGEEMLHALKYFGDFLLGNNGIESAEKDPESDGARGWGDLKRRKRSTLNTRWR